MDKHGEPNYIFHAVLGDGTFAHPSFIATHPDAHIKFGSMVYVKGVGWFVVNDRTARPMPKNTFDMWTGHSTKEQRSAVTRPRDVTVYGPGEKVRAVLRSQLPAPVRLRRARHEQTGR